MAVMRKPKLATPTFAWRASSSFSVECLRGITHNNKCCIEIGSYLGRSGHKSLVTSTSQMHGPPQYQKRQGSQGFLGTYCSLEVLTQWEEVRGGKEVVEVRRESQRGPRHDLELFIYSMTSTTRL